MGRNQIWAPFAVGLATILAIAICAVAIEIGAGASGSTAPSSRSTADPSRRTQPPSIPVGAGWSAANPSTPSDIAAEYDQWMPLVTSSLKVLEHVATDGRRATLASITNTESQNINPTSGKYAGSTVAILSLNGVVSAGGQTWMMTATSQMPFTAGGSVNYVSSTGNDVLVSLVGTPSDPYSATVGKWSNQLVP